MELTPGLRQRLAKDFQLPISLFEDKYYPYFKELYNSFYKVQEREDLMLDVLKGLSTSPDRAISKDNLDFNEQMEFAYFQYASSVNNRLKDIVRDSSAYKMMNDEVLQRESGENNVERKSIYVPENLNRRLISVDLNKANFNVFGLYGLKEELKIEGYNDFVALVSPYEYFTQSRMTRQVVFGDLNPKRQQNIQKKIIAEFGSLLKKNGLLITSSSSDELIIDPQGDENITMHLVNDILKDVPQNKKFFRVEEFVFQKVHPGEGMNYFFKSSVDTTGKVKEEFKNVSSLYFPQVFKHKFNMPLQKEDMFFVMEGKLSCFLEKALPKVENKQNLKLD